VDIATAHNFYKFLHNQLRITYEKRGGVCSEGTCSRGHVSGRAVVRGLLSGEGRMSGHLESYRLTNHSVCAAGGFRQSLLLGRALTVS